MSAKRKTRAVVQEEEGLTQDETARRVGCAKSTVWRAVRRGDVDTLANGRIPESEIEKLVEIRKEEERESRYDAELDRRAKIAETEKQEALAKLKNLELQLQSGLFVKLEDVIRDAADARERFLGIVRAIPQRTAMALECPCHKAAVVEAKISDEIERALAEIRKARFGA
jgi:hypothetical protein